jgi:hypothetical protein
MVFFGLLFGLVGTDVNTGAQRFTFDIPELSDGIDFAPVAMGLFGIAEIVANLERRMSRSGAIKVSSLWPTPAAARPSAPSRPIRWRRRSRARRRSSARARSRVSPLPNRRTTPRRRPRSSRC